MFRLQNPRIMIKMNVSRFHNAPLSSLSLLKGVFSFISIKPPLCRFFELDCTYNFILDFVIEYSEYIFCNFQRFHIFDIFFK